MQHCHLLADVSIHYTPFVTYKCMTVGTTVRASIWCLATRIGGNDIQLCREAEQDILRAYTH